MAKIRDIELGDFPLLLAPMEDVSDPPFRALCKQHGADLMYTEFISSEGLIRDAAKSVQKLDIFEYERPIGIQIFGSDIESMKIATEVTARANPDIIDINFGCPVKKVVSKGAGAGILKDIDLMVKLTEAMAKHTKIPITVKTRLGWDEKSIKILEVAERLQDVGCAAISIHGRTRAQMYKGKANWKPIAEVKNNSRMHIPIFGNGDVNTPEKAMEMRDVFGLDGAMIGRASIGNPWFFKQVKHYFETGEHLPAPKISEIQDIMNHHLLDHYSFYGEYAGVRTARKHIAWYLRSLPGGEAFRRSLNLLNDSAAQVQAVVDYLDQLNQHLELLLIPTC